MKHISNILDSFQTYVSRDHVLKSRLIDITESFLNITIKESQLKVSSRVILITRAPYVEKLLIEKEKQTILAYIHANSHGFKVDELVIQ